ncbi:glycoside hydrolase family 25 protein [Amycolatopsis suaedae]|uniref:Lysozyme n=1 Tax=Amycolatopsis suaedae TaxID=2510978 RepID=A0A4Q7J999_9PSEU|nr:glycoside hydrolase family 25 protein [Amycolatopsis suaedae]RZQ63462.1 lysozyme [Amycolatopsis suaedae]
MREPEPERGINLSHHDAVDNWAAVRAGGVVFAAVTITESTNWSDTAAARNLRQAQEAGIHTGARHFARPGSVHDQVEHFVRTAKRLGALSPGSLAPTLDVEVDSVDDRFIKSWIKAVRQATGLERVLVYARYEDWQHRLHPDRWADSEVILWLVRHNGIPGRPGWFHPRLGLHQHGGGDAVPGFHGEIGYDAVVYPFTLADVLI